MKNPVNAQLVEMLNEEVNKKAASDAAFKAALLKDARTVLNSLGMQIPADVVVKVEEKAGKLTVILPETATTGEVTDAALDKVAGGTLVPCSGVMSYKCTGASSGLTMPPPGGSCIS